MPKHNIIGERARELAVKRHTRSHANSSAVNLSNTTTDVSERQPKSVVSDTKPWKQHVDRLTTRAKYKDIFNAIDAGDIAGVKAFLPSQMENRNSSYEKETPLQYACKHGFDLIAYVLIKAGADVNSKDRYGNTPLHMSNNVEIFKLLLEAGADPFIRNDKGQTAIGDIAIGDLLDVPNNNEPEEELER